MNMLSEHILSTGEKSFTQKDDVIMIFLYTVFSIYFICSFVLFFSTDTQTI
jgi:hypothetical protein